MEKNELTGKKIILFGAGLMGKAMLEYLGSRDVKYFADNNKAGDFYCGKNVISFDELCRIHEDYDVVLAISYIKLDAVAQQLRESGIAFIEYWKLLSVDSYGSNPKLAKFHNIHKGERCFVIGNGPSLKAEDLDVLHKNGVISFGCNRIYLIFDKTEWRPKYHFTADPVIKAVDGANLVDFGLDHYFFCRTFAGDYAPPLSDAVYKDLSGRIHFYESYIYSQPQFGRPFLFSADPSRFIYSAFSVLYQVLQFAAYMGFSEIYLLGVDNNYTTNVLQVTEGNDPNHFDSRYTDNQFISTALQHISREINYDPSYLIPAMTATFAEAEAYSREHGFRIYNATRGGMLEVFERVDFDSLF